jgi:hypothetical protein
VLRLTWSICLLATFASAAFAVDPIAGGTAGARNFCTLVSAKQVASFGIPTQCKPTTLNGPGFTNSTGTWAKQVTATSPHLSVSCNSYQSTSSPVWKLGLTTLDKLPGKAKKVNGIGTLAYESGADGGTLSVINFIAGKNICDINMRTSQPPTSLAAFNTLAKSVAAKV